MRPFAFQDPGNNMVVVNPAQVVAVNTSTDSRRVHRVKLSLASPGPQGSMDLAVAEFAKKTDAERIGARLGEHLWNDQAAPLSEEEKQFIAKHRASVESTGDGEMVTVPAQESKHPAIVAEFQRQDAARRRRRSAGP